MCSIMAEKFYHIAQRKTRASHNLHKGRRQRLCFFCEAIEFSLTKWYDVVGATEFYVFSVFFSNLHIFFTKVWYHVVGVTFTEHMFDFVFTKSPEKNHKPESKNRTYVRLFAYRTFVRFYPFLVVPPRAALYAIFL